MSQELQLGKYEFYPYEFDKSETHSLEDLTALLKKAKARKKKGVKTPAPSVSKRRANNLNDSFNDI